ncbi:MAG: hypothetical protein HQ559_05150 [Lentisphaerae bacterium]|nr:hypothetical protein [Lentisphaerota bacterium]
MTSATKRTLGTVFLLTVLSVARTCAAEGTSTNAPAAPDTSFEVRRDPFWPVGWVPPDFGMSDDAAAPKLQPASRWKQALRLLKVTGITEGTDEYIAVIKGIGVVEEGDVIAVNYQGLIYKWIVRSINGKGIVPERLSISRAR